MLVSINIVAYNEEENIEKSLGSALTQSYANTEVFLIDNASKDRTIEKAEAVYKNSRSFVPFRIVRNEINFGFGGGHNVGFRVSSGDAVLCLNADCELDKNFVQYAVEVLQSDERVGAVQGKLANPRTGKIDTTGLVIFKNRRVVNRGQGVEDLGQFEHLEEIWGADGAAPVYRRVALDDIKIPVGNSSSRMTPEEAEYFDADFFAYKEDIDLAWRMRLAGWKIMYQPKAVARHDRSAGEGAVTSIRQIIEARKKVSEFAKFHSFANQRLMLIKNETPRLFFKYAPRIVAKEFAAIAYVLLFERYGLRATREFFRLLPGAIRKRKYVMARRRIKEEEMEKWFA